jgi:wobble nucleotide-excising tRNase
VTPLYEFSEKKYAERGDRKVLERVICIDNVGVFKKGVQHVSPLKKLTLIYADNARGKSTLSSVMLSCASQDAKELQGRKTFGATADQKVVMRFTPPAAASFNAEFSAAGWSGEKPNLHVFNQTFVERNVYAQGDVLPEQRESLLNLALGHAAIAERAVYEKQGALQKECATRVAAAEGALSGYRGELSLDQFIKLEPLHDATAQLEAVDKEISEARAASSIANRSSFRKVPLPSFDLSTIEEVLKSSFSSLALSAEQEAKAHFAKHNGAETERWVAEGLGHNSDEECPFCGQKTQQLALLSAYKEYFDGAFTAHLQRVAKLQLEVNAQLGDRQLLQWSGPIETNRSVAELWSESLHLDALPVIGVESATATLHAARETLSALVKVKAGSPHQAVDTSGLMSTKAELSKLVEANAAYNRAVDALNQKISAYKEKLAAPNIAALEAKRRTLAVREKRYEADVVLLLGAVEKARNDYKAAEKAKDVARVALDNLMAETLVKFQAAINGWLNKFAAPFSIENFASTHVGGRARSEYVLRVRGATVNIGPGGGGDMSFHAALSEGDKRTLAFAFFLAKLFADPNKAGAVVVLDDVFTSLDKHRRHNTIEAVLRMLGECAQVIALGHDAHFLRELKKRATKKNLADSVELTLQRDVQDFSYLDGTFDLEDYCSSEYYKHYVLVERYIDADPTVDRLEVAKALRLLVEGHLHRCFPKKFKEGQTVGEMLELVRTAVAPNPLVRLQPLRAELVSFNDFASAFHHDTSGGYPRNDVTDAELLPFAKGALGFIQVRSFQP